MRGSARACRDAFWRCSASVRVHASAVLARHRGRCYTGSARRGTALADSAWKKELMAFQRVARSRDGETMTRTADKYIAAGSAALLNALLVVFLRRHLGPAESMRIPADEGSIQISRIRRSADKATARPPVAKAQTQRREMLTEHPKGVSASLRREEISETGQEPQTSGVKTLDGFGLSNDEGADATAEERGLHPPAFRRSSLDAASRNAFSAEKPPVFAMRDASLGGMLSRMTRSNLCS